MSIESYHLIGVAGVGMSALAQLLVSLGHTVTGSDRYLDQGDEVDVVRQLRAAGVTLHPQDGSALTGNVTVVISTAIEEDNAELAAARELGCHVVHRAALLARLAEGHRTVAVTGTSGKTTVTGMIGWVFERLGLDPTVVNGGAVLGWNAPSHVGHVRVGQSDLWVFEADESDRSLLAFSPDWGVVTNISKDHFELDVTVDLFRAFAQRVLRGIVCGPGVASELSNVTDAVEITETVPPTPSLDQPSGFIYHDVAFHVPQIGRHNAANAMIVVALCERLGLALPRVAEALSSFPGIHRRLELVGDLRGIPIYDDYAHNPAKVAASWEAVAATAQRVLGVWRPHGFGPLAAMSEEMCEALRRVLRPADLLYVLPVYYAGGTASRTVTTEDFVTQAQREGVRAAVVPDYDALQYTLLAETRPGDVILCMGARDPELPRFARRLAAQGRRDKPSP